ncbi:DoxX family protein [Dyadobacter sediminis]|uniref:DoxX family protein n=1 Tax=Dyadobacter sediminis TaxID=1493691 RepID=A0A5R9KL00_9BACT|nr:DoxX family protein [Dyadobacter sediminis]TLU96891.1 DoxX family protein [Dyadobacter sediminis]GGB86010.1 membrane protein [Dyadobacter sediminis]
METSISQPALTKKPLNKVHLAGKIISGLCIVFLLLDALMKAIKDPRSMEGSVQLGWPAEFVQAIGIVLLVSTVLYLIPRTAVLGAILLTGYLGGAIAIMVRAGQPLYFALVFGILVWAGLYLRDEKLRSLIPFRKD